MAQEVRVGLAVPLTGPDAGFGAAMKIGAELAVSDVNAAGGMLGRTVRLVTVDDASDPKKGTDAAKQLIDAGVKLVVGDFSSAVALPTSAAYAQSGVLDIVPAAIAPQITERGLPTVFRLAGREDLQGEIVTRFLQARRYARVALLYDRSSSGKSFVDAVRAGLAARGNSEVFYGTLAPDAHDLSGTIARLRSAGAQIVVWGGGPAGAALLVRQLHDAGARIPLLGSLAMASEDFASQAGVAAEGTFMVFPQDPRNRAAAADLTRRFTENGADTNGYAYYAYAAIQLMAQAVQSKSSLEPRDVAAALHSGAPYKTVVGPLAFDPKGDPKASDLSVQVWRKGASGRLTFGAQGGG